MHESERRRTLRIKAKDCEIKSMSGVASRSLCNARKKLQEYGLVRYEAGVGNVYVYTICDPETGCPYPGEPNEPKRYVKNSELQTRPTAPLAVARTGTIADPNPPLETYGLPKVFGD
jgi:hypothetical protein